MPGARLVVDSLPAPGEALRIQGPEAAHARARRLSPGDDVILVDGSGREAVARVTRVSPSGVEVSVSSVRPGPLDRLAPITLFVAAVRAERLSWVAEKAAELGAARLALVVSRRTQRFRATETLLPRLRRVAREAAKQSESALWPQIEGPIPLDRVLGSRDGAAGNRLVLDPSGEPFPSELPSAPTALLVGPEGGWTDEELASALAAGWIAASLAAGKLRAETAAVAALTLARHALSRRVC